MPILDENSRDYRPFSAEEQMMFKLQDDQQSSEMLVVQELQEESRHQTTQDDQRLSTKSKDHAPLNLLINTDKMQRPETDSVDNAAHLVIDDQ